MSDTLKDTVEEFKAWRESRVLLRHCPCCGSEVFFDREKDAALVVDVQAGTITIRLKNGQTRVIETLKLV